MKSCSKSVLKNKTKPHRHIFGIMLAPQCWVFFFFLCLNDFVNKMYFVYPKFGEMAGFFGVFLSA